MLSLLIGAIFILAIGKEPFEIYTKLIGDSLGNSYGIGMVLFKSTPLIFTGLAVAYAFKAGLFNIGAEGQLNIGALTMAWAGFAFNGLPWIIHIPLCLAAGFIGGAFWGAIAGYLKSRFGSHEVINTIMLNFIALALVNYFVNAVFLVPATVHTPEISDSAVLLRLDTFASFFHGSPFNLSFFIAIVLTLLMYYLIWKTPYGYETKTLGSNPNAARYAKMNVKRLTVLAMAISGGFAGLAGSNFVLGYKHYFELGFSDGAGYIGIAVALIARNNPFAVILVALFFGVLEYGGLTINTLVPKEIVTMLQAIVIIFVIVFTKAAEKYQRKVQAADA